VHTNLSFLETLLGHPQFTAGAIDTGFVTRLLASGIRVRERASHG
jgi:hypothetical protein